MAIASGTHLGAYEILAPLGWSRFVVHAELRAERTLCAERLAGERQPGLHADGQRFLFVTSAEDANVPPFTVVLNWMAEVMK